MIPPSLAPWAGLLALFPEDLRPAMASLLGPLQRLLDSPLAPPQHGMGEPAGYSGISRRGIPERILLSEWLLADELPEEFLRRAATGQLAYLELDRREKQPHRSIFALFDTGPAQAGAPRVAQLAVLLVLLQRAQAAGVSLSWGILQAPELGLSIARPTREALLPLPNHRTYKSVDKTSLGGWNIPVDAELWLVGSAELGQLSHRGPRLVLEDLLLPRSLDLEVTFRPESGPPTVLNLPMPSEPDCVRLLTLEEPAPRRKKADPALLPPEAIQWSSNSSRLLVRAKNLLRIYSFNYRDTGHPEPGRLHTRQFPPSEQVIAADYHWGRLVAVTLEENGTAWLYGMGRPDPGGRGPARWKLEHTGLVGPKPRGEFLLAGVGNTLYLLDRKRLFRLQPNSGGMCSVAEQRRLRQLHARRPVGPLALQHLMATPGLDPAAAEHWALHGWSKGPLRLPYEVSMESLRALQSQGFEVEHLHEPTLLMRQVAEELLLIAPGPLLLSQGQDALKALSTRLDRGPFCLGGTPNNRSIAWYTQGSIEIHNHSGSWQRTNILERHRNAGYPVDSSPFWLICATWGPNSDADLYFRDTDQIAVWPLRGDAPVDGFSFRNELVQAAVDPYKGVLAWLDDAGNIGVSYRRLGVLAEGTPPPMVGTVVEGEDAWFAGAPPERELPKT